MGPGVAMECLKTTGTARKLFGKIISILKLLTGDGTPLADGEHGELLFTTLTKEALPVWSANA